MMISSFKSVEGIRLVYKFKKINVLRNTMRDGRESGKWM